MYLVGCLYYCIRDTRSHKHQITENLIEDDKPWNNRPQFIGSNLCLLAAKWFQPSLNFAFFQIASVMRDRCKMNIHAQKCRQVTENSGWKSRPWDSVNEHYDTLRALWHSPITLRCSNVTITNCTECTRLASTAPTGPANVGGFAGKIQIQRQLQSTHFFITGNVN